MRVCSPAFAEFAPITILLDACRPNAILRRIVTIIVDSFDSHFWCRPGAHIVKKEVEGTTPAVADLNSSTTVTLVGWILRIFAPAYHRTPSTVFDRPAAVMSYVSDPSQFDIKTSARACVTAPKCGLIDNLGRSALTFAEPPSQIFSRLCFFQDGQSSVLLAHKIHSHDTNCIRRDWRVKPL
jgi:hypothetical protein